jgi:hypothetical protein
MTEHHSTLRTPLMQDKRFLVTLYALTGLFAGVLLHVVPATDYVLGGIIAITLGFAGVSQYGQTKRTTELLKAAAPIEEPDVKVEVKT